MVWQEVFGFIAGAVMTVGFVPQVWRLYKLKSAREISLPFISLYLVGSACWLSYGVLLGLPPIILWNAITLLLGIAMLYAKFKYGKS